jgi:phosphate-selective porin
MSRRILGQESSVVRHTCRLVRSVTRLGMMICLVSTGTAARAADFSVGDGGSLRLIEGENTFQLAGRAVIGAATYSHDVTPLSSGLETDLVLLAARAHFGHGWNINVSYDFNGQSFFDTSITKSGLPIGAIQVGQFRPQVGLYDGGAWSIFAQRSMIEQALAIPRTLGVGLEGGIGPVSYSFAANGDQIGNDTPGRDPRKYSTRLVFRPAPPSWGTFQVGINGIHQETPDTRINKVSVNPVPALDETPTILAVSQSSADARNVVGGEVLWSKGPWTVQSEYLHAAVQSPGSPHFEGYYAQGTYAIGAHRDFSRDSGTFGRPQLWNPAAGAWELALRYDTIDFASAGGGAADNVSLAIIRYFSNPLRVGATFAHSSIRSGLNGDEAVSSIQVKAQWFL